MEFLCFCCYCYLHKAHTLPFHNRLLFMTYNGLVMVAVGVGAFIGYLVFGEDTAATKSVACH